VVISLSYFLGALPLAFAADLVDVQISGVEGALLTNVKAFLSIAELEADSKRAPEVEERLVRRAHQVAGTEIGAALRPFGYYDPKVSASLEAIEGQWRAEYRIDPGAPVRVERVDIGVEGDGQGEPKIAQALATVAIKPGGVLLHSQYERAKEALLRASLSEGFLDARFTRSELRVDPATQRAEVFLKLDTGAQYFFGPVTVEQDILKPAFVNRFVTIEPGEPFDPDRLLQLQLALNDSGYFSRVEVQPQRARAEKRRVPVTVVTEPTKPRRYAAGIGFGTDTGPRFTLGTEFRRLNRGGHTALVDLLVSAVKRRVGAQYRIPIANVLTDRLVFLTAFEDEDVADGSSRRYTLGVSRNDTWRGMNRRLFANLQRDDFDLGEEDEDVTFLIPGINLSRSRADELFYPRDAFSWSVDLRGASEDLVADTTFVRSLAAVRRIRPLGGRGRLLMRSEIGATAVDDFSKLPTSERFFAGGDRSVRGYRYQDLGPTDASGDNIGGEYLLVGSLEADYLFFGNFGGAVFVDAGNAADTFPPDPKFGAGLGPRWRSPVGMVGADFAYGFDDDAGVRLHVSIEVGL
jgi:translocation and assembly module TamA